MATVRADGSLPSQRQLISVTLSTTSTGQSDAIDCAGATLSSILMATSAWTNASMTFLGSIDGSNFYDIYGSTGNEIAYTTTASRLMTFDPAFWLGMRWIKIRSGTTATPVAQAAERTLIAMLQGLGAVK